MTLCKSLKFSALALALAFVSMPVAAQDTVPPEWFACKQSSDCVVVGETCTVTAVNAEFQIEARKYYNNLAARVECNDHTPASAYDTSCRGESTPCLGADGKPDPSKNCTVHQCTLVNKENEEPTDAEQ